MVKCSVLFEVRTGYLNIIQTSFVLEELKWNFYQPRSLSSAAPLWQTRNTDVLSVYNVVFIAELQVYSITILLCERERTIYREITWNMCKEAFCIFTSFGSFTRCQIKG
jgi:hypothetical protein